ncbi:MAG TPA: LysR family transcriptional regulator [Halomonas sp.]|nr:LysR family transcriptional regulator [Halomonas sp.]
MNRNDLRRIDFHLLIVFEPLMHERSVTRTAEKLFLDQPAISAALSRLRVLFGDQLFIRIGRNMEPTARAREIFIQLQPALDADGSPRIFCYSSHKACSPPPLSG